MLNDSHLYTGISSATANRVAKERQDMKQTKKEQRRSLLPNADLILASIRREQTKAMLVTDVDITSVTSPDAFLIEMKARKMYAEYLEKLATTISIIVKEPADERPTE